MGTIFLARPVVTGQGVMVLKSGRVDLGWVYGRHFLWWGWWNTGTSCPEK